MKLLTPPAGKSRQQVENASQELRAIQLDELIRAKRKELNDLDALTVSALSRSGIEHYEEEQKWKEKINTLTIEVEALESRRKSALVPLEEREKQVQDKDSALSKREETIAIKETDLEQTREILEDRLDAVSEREQDATKYSQILNNREFAVQLQEKQIAERMKALTDILRESYEDIQTAKTEAAQRKALLKGRDVSITERERNVEMQEKSFANREKSIVDRYLTLQRAITEVNLKNNASSNRSVQ